MNTIFLLGPDNNLVELTRTPYNSEDLFQGLLGSHPALLRAAAGPDGRMLLVRREQSVPGEQEGSGRWSLDHLFLDRQGVPVLVEVKRATDTRARREVVAQMLDYAANGVAYWPIDKIIEAFNATAVNSGGDADSALAAFLDGSDPEQFWRGVEANLRAGRIRMLFVADRIPPELARIIEFLNEQMRPAEVLAIEVEQYVGLNGMKTLVPKTVGQTERALSAKAVGEPKVSLDATEWLTKLASKHGVDARRAAEKLSCWLKENRFDVVITNSQDAMSAAVKRPNGKPTWFVFMRMSSGRLEIALQYLAYSEYYKTPERRSTLIQEMQSLPAATLRVSKDAINGYPSMALTEILNDTTWTAFTAFVAGIAENVKAGDV